MGRGRAEYPVYLPVKNYFVTSGQKLHKTDIK